MNETKNGGTVPLYLNKINSDKKAIECASIIEAGHSSHFERLWLVGFLRFCDYSMDEVLDIIRQHSEWADYDDRITAYQVGSVFGRYPQRTQNHSAPRPGKWTLSNSEILRIRRQHSISLSSLLCEEHNIPVFPHPERLSHPFNSWSEFLQK